MIDASDRSAWQLDQNSPAAYEDYLVGRFFRRWAERLLAHADVSPGDRILDAGCGTGIVARTAASRIGQTGQVVGLDINDGMLSEARRQDTDDTVSWETGALEDMPFDDGSFDVILSQQVLQFVPDRALALAELHRTLAPGGKLVIASLRDLDFNRSYEALATALERNASQEAGDMMRSPFSGPDANTIRQELGAQGFTRISIQNDILDVRFPSASEYLRQEAASSPLAEPLAELNGSRLGALITDLEEVLSPFTDDHGIAFPMETYFVTAYR